MGIKKLLGQLPGGKAEDTRRGFGNLKILRNKNRPVDIDTGTLIFACTLKHRVAHNAGNYEPAAREFQRILITINLEKWDYCCVFDGRPPIEKQHEHQRRKDRNEGSDDAITINSTFIAMCSKVCNRYFANYVVGPSEADMQVGRRREGTVAVCRDADLIAYGHKIVVIVDSYSNEEYRVIDMEAPVDAEMKDTLPLYFYYRRFGLRVIHWWAAVMGCDISVNENGILYAGPKAFFKALRSLDHVPSSDLSTLNFANALREHVGAACRLSWGVHQLAAELDRVAKLFTSDGTYYDDDGNVLKITGELVRERSRATVRHMRGDLDPKTGAEFTASQKAEINAIECHNLLHNSAARRSSLRGLSLPEGRENVESCRVEELKAMLVVRGGSVTSKEGRALNRGELVQLVKAYMSMESQNQKHTTYFNRTRVNNGIFANIDTSVRRTVPQIVQSLVNCDEFEPSLHQFFVYIQLLLTNERFSHDYGSIALEAPELQEKFIHESFFHVGESTNQKNITSGLTKVLEMDKLIYHANAWSEDGKSLYILSKQVASQVRDAKTRKKTAHGEKPLSSEYLVMMQLLVSATTVESHGHTLGIISRIMRSYCGSCVAGCGMCYHRGALLWMQHMHWGEGRPTPKPTTSGFCPWIPGGRSKRNNTTLKPASTLIVEKLPRSNAEAQAKLDRGRKHNLREGLGASYDVRGGNERKLGALSSPEYVSAGRVGPLFRCLRAAQRKATTNDEDDE
ncbi:hypothetical protein ACHAWF_017125 [Thalassiosira exigua]